MCETVRVITLGRIVRNIVVTERVLKGKTERIVSIS